MLNFFRNPLEGGKMLVIDGNSVYEIDEECLRKKKVPEECRVYEKLLQEQERMEQKHSADALPVTEHQESSQ